MTEKTETKRGRGRPKKLTSAVSITLDIERVDKEALFVIAKEANMKVAELVRMLISELVVGETTYHPEVFRGSSNDL